jgi:hypothetical protein
VEHASPSSGSHRTDSDAAANRQHRAVAQPNATISRGWSIRPHHRDLNGPGLRPSKGAALGSSDVNAADDPPDRTADAEPATVGYSQRRPYTDAER